MRYDVIVGALNDASKYIRDAATMVISALGDKKFIENLQKAAGRETISGLKSDMETVVRELLD
jgi:hypothetical protein